MRGIVGMLLLAAVAQAEPQTAADVTERGAALRPILDALLYPENAPPRSILLVVDPSPSLNAARFADTLAELLRVRRTRQPRPRLGVVVLGAKDAVPPGATPDAIVAAIREGLRAPTDEVRNVYAAVRDHLPLLKGKDRRELLLVTLENGDLEDDLEQTVAAAKRADTRIHVLAREAFLSDTYWQWCTPPAAKGEFTGSDGAYVDIPWGWVFQREHVTEAAPSGHAMYGLSRLAAATDGRVFVFYPTRGQHRCEIGIGCSFCPGDHIAPLEVLRSQRVRAIAAPVAARRDILAEGGKDAFFRAVLDAWEAAAKEGLARAPRVRRRGKALVPSTGRERYESWAGTNWRGMGRKASKMASAAEKIARRLEADMKDAEGSARNQSIAELTYLMLRITRVNLLLCEAYCKEVADRMTDDVEPPQRSLVPDDYRITGLGYDTMSLCHGVAPFAGVRMPGGEKLKKEIADLDAVLKSFHRRNAYTPFAVAAARMGIATFHPAGVGKVTTLPPRDVSGSSTESTTTRPSRGGGTSGGTTGPTSGGG